MSKFQIGDRVEFIEDYCGVQEGSQGTVTDVELGSDEGIHDTFLVWVELDGGRVCDGAFEKRLKPVKDAVAQPVTFRICVGTTMGTTEYKTQEAALEAAREHGVDGEEFSIWEVVKIADYRMKVTKETVAL